jgi:rubrerythrin
MNAKITACELIGIARRVEETGAKCYEDMKKRATEPDMVSLLDYLAKEETEHVATFQEIFADVSCHPETMADPGPGDQSYLRTLMNSIVFDGPEAGLQLALKAQTPDEMVKFALQFERDAMLFWVKLFALARPEDRPLVQRLIKQEEEHISKLGSRFLRQQVQDQRGVRR